MKKLISFVLAIVATTTMAFAADPQTGVTVDCGKQVQISATPATGWHFVKWNDENTENPRIITPSADAQYVATFAIDEYTIIFKNEDGTVLESKNIEYNQPVIYTGSTPTKAATAQYTYTFAGWNNNIVSPATGDATYTATFTSTVNKYTITFKNYDGTVLQSTQVEYGLTPAYIGATPTKPADAENNYTFTGWDKTINMVTGNEEYIAQYSNSTNIYNVTIEDGGDEGDVEGAGTYPYGTPVSIKATPKECYRFVHWSDGNTNAEREITVTGNITYKAIFEKIQYTITTAPDDVTHGSTTAVEL